MLEQGEVSLTDRPELINTLGKMCRRLKTIPDSMRIENCIAQTHEEYGGGFAKVSRGEYRGRAVAIKLLHIYVTSDLEECFDVSLLLPGVFEETIRSSLWVFRNSAEKSLPGGIYNTRTSFRLSV
jgi:hypothetical protein